MILQKVIIQNIRSHTYFEFEPVTQGTTAICGENGAGKSTIVDSFAWSLFGTRLHNLRNKNYIQEGKDPKVDPVKVESFFIEGNREYKVERIIINKEGTTICNVYSRAINNNDEYKLDCGPSISHSEAFIRNLLKCDEKGFMASVFIQQKQVDQIISASPRERGQVIEKLIGVSAITEAHQIAKDESRAYQKALSIIQPGSIEDELAKVENQKNIVTNLNKTIAEQKSLFTNMTQELEQVTNEYNTQKAKQEEYNKVSESYKLSENTLKHLEERLVAQLELYKQFNSTNVTFTPKILLDSEKELTKLKEEKETLLKKSVLLKNELTELDVLYSHKINNSVITKKQELEKNNIELNEQIEKDKFELSLENNKIKHNKKYLEELKNGIAVCPMCNSEITDVELEKEKHLKVLNESIEHKKILETRINELTEKSNVTLQKIIEYSSVIEILEAQHKNKVKYQDLLNGIKKNDKLTELNSLAIIKIEKLISELNLQKQSAEQIALIKFNIDKLNREITTEKEKFSEFTNLLSSIQALTQKEYLKLENKYFKMTKDYQALELHIAKLENQLVLAKQQGRDYLSSLQKCKEANAEHLKVSKQMNTLNMVAKTLSEFKDLRVKTSIPELTNIASDILTKFTNGEFIRLTLSETFDAYVETNTGKIRPVAQLSGGELSAAAIALRLAIALFLHNEGQNLLILDEVLVSMSEERSQLILETITSLTTAQIIFIAHSQVVNSFADKIINI